MVIVLSLGKRRFPNDFRPHEDKKPEFSDSFGLKSVFRKLCFRDGLMWTVEMKLRF